MLGSKRKLSGKKHEKSFKDFPLRLIQKKIWTSRGLFWYKVTVE
jgi:hypothetical protein